MEVLVFSRATVLNSLLVVVREGLLRIEEPATNLTPQRPSQCSSDKRLAFGVIGELGTRRPRISCEDFSGESSFFYKPFVRWRIASLYFLY